MGSQLRVVSLRGRNILGEREFSLSLGKVTILTGKNASGKSSRLAALQATLGGGNLAKLAHISNGEAGDAEAVLILDGEGEHFQVERSGKKIRVRSRVGDSAALEDVPQPQTWLSGLFDGRGANPIRFLTASDKERATLLLEALPLEFDRATLLAEMGVSEAELKVWGAVPTGMHALEEIAGIRESVFRARTGVNRDQKGQAASAEQLRRNIPATPPEGPAAEIAARDQAVSQAAETIARDGAAADGAEREAVAAAQAARDLVDAEVRGDFKAQAAKLRRSHEARAAELRADVEQKISDDLAAVNAAVGGLQEAGGLAMAEAEKTAEDAAAGARHVRQAARVEIERAAVLLVEQREGLAALRAQQAGASKAAALLEQVEGFEAESDRLGALSSRLTDAIEKLDTHRRHLGEDLPIKGLSIQGRDIRVDDIPYEQLNAGQQTEIAVQIAVLRAQGRLPIVFIDGAETLDSQHFDALVHRLQQLKGQYILARVEDHDFEADPPEAYYRKRVAEAADAVERARDRAQGSNVVDLARARR